MYCQNCGLFFMDEAKDCPECGEALSPTIAPEDNFEDGSDFPGAAAGLRADPEISPKKRNTVILLSYFFGIFGVHRFYLGKIVSGLLMLLTFGGLTVWASLDFVKAVCGKYSDSRGRPVSGEYSGAMVVILIVAPVVLLIAAAALLFVFSYARFGGAPFGA